MLFLLPSFPLVFFHRTLSALTTFMGAMLIASCTLRDPNYALTVVKGHLPNLQFTLMGGDGQAVNADALRGTVVMVYFGYTHCPDVCPTTMARLTQAVQMLDAEACAVRIVFISVDPARDTPLLMHSYATAFDPQHAVGLTGDLQQIRALARRYRLAYQAKLPDSNGTYEVTHSSAVYIFDRQGRARLMASENDSVERIVHDLRQLIREPA